VNTLVSQVLFKVGKKAQSIALQADAWHLRTDVYTSLGVMVGLISIWLCNRYLPGKDFRWIDPVAALFVALLILKAAYELTVVAGRDLFDTSLPKEELRWIKKLLVHCPEAKGFHHLRTRKAGMHRYIEFHLVVGAKLTVAVSHELTDELSDKIRGHFKDSHVTIHVEPCDNSSCTKHCLAGCFKK